MHNIDLETRVFLPYSNYPVTGDHSPIWSVWLVRMDIEKRVSVLVEQHVLVPQVNEELRYVSTYFLGRKKETPP